MEQRPENQAEPALQGLLVLLAERTNAAFYTSKDWKNVEKSHTQISKHNTTILQCFIAKRGEHREGQKGDMQTLHCQKIKISKWRVVRA